MYTFLGLTIFDVVFDSTLLRIRILIRITVGITRMMLPTTYAIPGNPDNRERGVNMELNISAPEDKKVAN